MTAQQLVVIATFEDEATATDALQVLQEAHREEQLEFKAYAVVRRDAENKLHVKETGDPGGVAGAVSGSGKCDEQRLDDPVTCRKRGVTGTMRRGEWQNAPAV